MKKELKRKILISIVSFLLSAGIMYFFGVGQGNSYILFLLILIAMYWLIGKAVAGFSKRRMIFAAVFAVPFAMMTWLGSKIQYPFAELAAFSVTDIVKVVALIGVMIVLMIDLLLFIDEKQLREGENVTAPKYVWLKATLSMLVVWSVAFLIFCPGLISVDTVVQFGQTLGEGALSNWHPVLHTLFLGLFVNIGNALGNLTFGIALAVLMQMIVVAIIFGYVVKWAFDELKHKGCAVGLWMFLVCCPTVILYAITPWKDIMFSALMFLLFTQVVSLVRHFSRENIVKLKDILPIVIIATLMAFFRNGGIYIVAALFIILFIYYIKNWKMLLWILGMPLILIYVIQGPIYKMCGVASSPFMESMSVPAQQLAYAVNYGELTEEEYGKLDKLADIDALRENYEPMHADAAKVAFDYGEVEKNKDEFMELWLSVLKHNFSEYVASYFYHTYAYWYIGGTAWVVDFENVHDEQWFKPVYYDLNLLGDGTRDVVMKLFQGVMSSSWLGWMNNVGILVWWMLLILMVNIYQKRYYLIVPLSIMLVYVATLLIASPVSWIFRYVYSLLLIVPVGVMLWFVPDARKKSGKVV